MKWAPGGFIVTKHEGACEQEVKSRGRGIWRIVHSKPRQIGYDYNVTFSISPRVLILHLKYEYVARKRAVWGSTHIVTSRGAP